MSAMDIDQVSEAKLNKSLEELILENQRNRNRGAGGAGAKSGRTRGTQRRGAARGRSNRRGGGARGRGGRTFGRGAQSRPIQKTQRRNVRVVSG